MKKTTATIAAILALSLPGAGFGMDHDSMQHGEHGTMSGGAVVHQEVIDTIKATFTVVDMKESMQGMEMPKGMKETHHLMVTFSEVKNGKLITDGEVKAKVQAPDKSEQVKNLMKMEGHFGADFDLSQKGKYGVMVKFKIHDGKVRTAKFWYTAT